jgi:hypothetical protein
MRVRRSIAALAVGMALSESGRSERSERANGQAERSNAEHRTHHPNIGIERIPENKSVQRLQAFVRPERSAHERVLSALRAKDGVLFGGQGALGASFGWSNTHLHEVLHELQIAGRVRLAVSRRGTTCSWLRLEPPNTVDGTGRHDARSFA